MYRQSTLIKILGFFFFFKLCNSVFFFFLLDVSRLTLCQSILCMNKPEKKELISTEDQKARKLFSAQRSSPWVHITLHCTCRRDWWTAIGATGEAFDIHMLIWTLSEWPRFLSATIRGWELLLLLFSEALETLFMRF